jgi:hypothetical protein
VFRQRGAPVDQLRWSGQPVGPIGRPQGAYLLKNCYVLKNWYLLKNFSLLKNISLLKDFSLLVA